MQIGDSVVRKSYGKDVTFEIVDIKEIDSKIIYLLQGINLRIIADSPEEDLVLVKDTNISEVDAVFNKKVNSSIKSILMMRGEDRNQVITSKSKKIVAVPSKEEKELTFGRPGKILHVDGDERYMDECMKVYKQLALIAEGRVIPESQQPIKVIELVKEVKPDIVVITGHDGVAKGTQDFLNLNNYRNSRYFVETVTKLRDYQSSYDELVIFAGACQSCYEALLDAGANFASSPGRVLIHCLDPVFICEKIAYTNIERIVSIQDALKNTITGVKGIGGLQTRGRYREGFPKSTYI